MWPAATTRPTRPPVEVPEELAVGGLSLLRPRGDNNQLWRQPTRSRHQSHHTFGFPLSCGQNTESADVGAIVCYLPWAMRLRSVSITDPGRTRRSTMKGRFGEAGRWVIG